MATTWCQPMQAQSLDSVQTLTLHRAVLSYDNRLGIPVYIAWNVGRDDVGAVKREPAMSFRVDPRVAGVNVKSSDYNHSGYHRGHMVPAADRSKSVQLMKETFIMTNVCPQLPSLNTGAWLRMENRERALALSLGGVHIRVAPIFTHEDTVWIANGRVAVPHGFIKVIYAVDSLTALDCRLFTNQHE